MITEEFLTWSLLGSYAGAVTATALITQFLKAVPLLKKAPPQLLSLCVAVVLLELSMLFSGAPTLENALLSLINAVIVALSANGAYDAVHTSSSRKEESDNG